MSNILKVTTPTTGYDNNNGIKTGHENMQQSQNVQGQVRPDKVVRPDARSDAAPQKQDGNLKFQFETNFDNFIQQLARNGNITEEYSTVLLEKLGMLAQSGLKAGMAGEISQFLSLISMSPEEMAAFLKTQGDSAVRFNGAFFDILRQIMQQTNSVELRTGILSFLKMYTDMAEGQHLLETMRQLIQNMKGGMLRSESQQLQQMEQGLNYGAANGNVKENANLIKNQIMPFLNEYITKMHDRGMLRESTAMLGSLTARYENGDAGRLQEAFLKLMDFTMFAKRFQNMDPAMLMRILANSEFERASRKNEAMARLADIIRSGVMGEAGVENKMAFKSIMQAFLLNESVYMPVLHLTLPLNVNGTLMFSELWIDPDDQSGGKQEGDERVIKGLIKFDIKDVGFFDLFFLYGTESEKVSIQLNYPKNLDASEAELRNAIGQILSSNNLEQEQLVLGSEEGSIPISAAFPNIFERKGSVNVTV